MIEYFTNAVRSTLISFYGYNNGRFNYKSSGQRWPRPRIANKEASGMIKLRTRLDILIHRRICVYLVGIRIKTFDTI